MSFFALSSTHTTVNGNNKNIGFPTIVTNVGGGFKSDGTFKAPSDGVYVFNWTILCGKATGRYVNSYLKKNNDAQAGIVQVACTAQNAQSSSTAVLKLNANDVVRLAADGPTNGEVYGYAYSSFSGWAL